jgi:anhydro-N-acetylmuramic acid kinase
MPEYYAGTLSGTSADGIDVVLVDFADVKPRLVAVRTYPMPDAVRSEVRALATPTDNEIERLGRLDVTLGRLIAESVNALLAEAGIAPGEVVAIGSHGQTLRHRPDADPPFTLQAGDPNTIAARTGITTVADFRRMDMALGGQGAPLAPAFHATILRELGNDRAVVNIGGIANLTQLPGNPAVPIYGYDIGPGNCLIDDWATLHLGTPFDQDGAWASSGTCLYPLLTQALNDRYFALSPPKSSGREYFNLKWLDQLTAGIDAKPADIQATLLELTATTIADAVKLALVNSGECLICGGGIHNKALMSRLRDLIPGPVESTAIYGLDPDWVEATMLAWLARHRYHQLRLEDLPAVTGSVQGPICGSIYLP